jgi:hypothetical protein
MPADRAREGAGVSGAAAIGPRAPRAARIHRHTVTDTTIRADDLHSPDGLLRILSALTGQRLEHKCLRADRDRCKDHPEGPCQGCIADDQFKVLAAGGEHWTRAKLNQALLLVRRPPVSAAFFSAFWSEAQVDDAAFLSGLAQFRCYAMLVFGSFRLAFAELGRADLPAIRDRLGRWADDPAALRGHYRDRPHGTTLVDRIDADERWHLGYVSSTRLTEDLRTLAVMRKLERGETITDQTEQLSARGIDAKTLAYWRPHLDAIERALTAAKTALERVRKVGLANTHAYLAANHIDVYVATSMRERWEYLAVAEFIQDIFETQAGINALGDITPFDPTLAYTSDRIDKGLLEALMLRRAACTVYMVQETDTLGKDSELAVTLALGRVVIAYVPKSVSSNAFQTSLDHLRKRILMLLAEDRITPIETAIGAVKDLAVLFDRRTDFKLLDPEEQGFRDKNTDLLTRLAGAAAVGEGELLNSRARTLTSAHPLALQVELESGVANGVLVARTQETVADLVGRVLTNTLLFRIARTTTMTDDQPAAVALVEQQTGCAFRVVTSHELLTSSFWSLYAGEEEVTEAMRDLRDPAALVLPEDEAPPSPAVGFEKQQEEADKNVETPAPARPRTERRVPGHKEAEPNGSPSAR